MHPVASMVSAAAKGPGPIAAILSPRRATSALRRGDPVPSTTIPPVIVKSKFIFSPSVFRTNMISTYMRADGISRHHPVMSMSLRLIDRASPMAPIMLAFGKRAVGIGLGREQQHHHPRAGADADRGTEFTEELIEQHHLRGCGTRNPDPTDQCDDDREGERSEATDSAAVGLDDHGEGVDQIDSVEQHRQHQEHQEDRKQGCRASAENGDDPSGAQPAGQAGEDGEQGQRHQRECDAC